MTDASLRKQKETIEEVSTSEYFSSSKRKSSTKPKAASPPPPTQASKTDSPAKNTRSARNPKPIIPTDDEGLGGDDIFAAGKASRDDDYVEEIPSDSDDMVFEPVTKKEAADRLPTRSIATARTGRAQRHKASDDMDDFLDSDSDAFEKPMPRGTTTTTRKKSAPDVKIPTRPSSSPPTLASKRKLEERSDGRETKKTARTGPGARAAAAATTSTASPQPRKSRTAKSAAEPDNSARQNILDSIPTIRPPTPPQEIKKYNPYAPAPSRDPPSGGEPAETPVGAENCLTGLTFVFTGTLNTLGRDEGISLVKQYGGKVTGSPSSRTSFVVLGSDAGPKKLQTIAKFNLRTIDENGLFELIRKLPANGGSGK
ncbi:hypothetical protein KEM56_004769, partial [Ascosphaera pollenicola]